MTATEKFARSSVVAGCAYEIAAITTRKVPTISHITRTHHAVEVALLGAFLAHIHSSKLF